MGFRNISIIENKAIHIIHCCFLFYFYIILFYYFLTATYEIASLTGCFSLEHHESNLLKYYGANFTMLLCGMLEESPKTFLCHPTSEPWSGFNVCGFATSVAFGGGPILAVTQI